MAMYSIISIGMMSELGRGGDDRAEMGRGGEDGHSYKCTCITCTTKLSAYYFHSLLFLLNVYNKVLKTV